MARYTASEMVQAAKGANHARVSERLIDDWVAAGLLDQPESSSRGRYGRTPGTWGENQLRLFLSLLEVHVHTKAMAELCNLPVWLWLWWGDDYVPMRQMKKAMTTWAAAAKKKNQSRAAKGISHLVKTWGNSDTPWAATQRLAGSLPPMIAKGKADKRTVRQDVAGALDPTGGSSSEGGLSADGYAGIFRARVEVLARLTAPVPKGFKGGKLHSPISDDLFEWARVFYLSTRQGYDRKRPRLAAAFGTARYGDGTIDEIVTDCCVDLATIIGLELTGQIRVQPGSMEDPELWKAGGLRSRLTTTATDEGIDVEIQLSNSRALDSP